MVPASIAADPPSVKAHVGAVVTSELDVNVRVTMSPLFALPSPLTVIAGVLRVGWVLSMVTLELSETAVTAVPALFASSEKAIEKVIAPSLSVSEVETAQVHAFEEPSLTDTELSMVLPAPSFMVHVGFWMASEAVKLRVISSPSLALPVPAVAIETEDRVGAVVSKTYD